MLAVISDKKLGDFTTDVISANDYYPFGMTIKSRSFSSEEYRFGFNGKENDNNFGEGHLDFGEGHLDFGARIYNSRIGRWFATDPLQAMHIDLPIGSQLHF